MAATTSTTPAPTMLNPLVRARQWRGAEPAAEASPLAAAAAPPSP